MKKLFPLLLFIVIIGCQDKKNVALERVWIPIQVLNSDKEQVELDYQNFLQFKGDSIKVLNAGLTDEKYFPFSINDEGYLSSYQFGKGQITFLSQDSLHIQFNENYRVKFIPLPELNISANKEEIDRLLSSFDWQYNEDSTSFDFEFKLINENIELTRSTITEAKSANIYQRQNGLIINQEDAFYSTKRIDDAYILSIEAIYDRSLIFTIYLKEIEQDYLNGVFWHNGELKTITFNRINTLSKEELSIRKDLITNRKWNLTNHEIANNYSGLSIGLLEDTDLSKVINKQDFKNKSISYYFTPSEFKIFRNGNLIMDGKWELSKSGEILKLQHSRNIDNDTIQEINYVQILNLSNSKLKIVKRKNLHIRGAEFEIIDFIQEFVNKKM
jgi:hypothetical protein